MLFTARSRRADPTSAVASFVAPTGAGPVAFSLVVTGPAGTSAPVTVTVQVLPAVESPLVVADAGTDLEARRGAAVTLDGSASVLADDYRWRQVGPVDDAGVLTAPVSLTGAEQASARFTFPLLALPAQNTTGNPGYTVNNPVLTVGTAEFRAGREWRVAGTSTILGGQRIAVVLGTGPTGRVLGYANVDAAGAFSFRGAGAIVPPTSVRTVSVVTAAGGELSGVTFRRR